MFDRLASYYKSNKGGVSEQVSVIWNTIVTQYHSELHKILEHGNQESLDNYMSTILSSGSMCGLEEHSTIDESNPRYGDFLIRLSKKVGIEPIVNPEQTSLWQRVLDMSRIEDSLGFTLRVPKFKGYGNGIPSRMFPYASAAFDIKLQFRGSFPKHILEIGAGLGNLGVIAFRLKSESYSIVDLPTTSVIAAYILAECFGESIVWLYGEGQPKDQFVRVYPSTRVDDITIPCDLAFNSDSIPEMPMHMQDQYVQLISRSLTRDGLFFSINHESDNLGQGRVLDAVKRNGSMNMLSRSPFMMRDGYIQEVYYV